MGLAALSAVMSTTVSAVEKTKKNEVMSTTVSAVNPGSF